MVSKETREFVEKFSSSALLESEGSRLKQSFERTLQGLVTPNAEYCFNLQSFRKNSDFLSLAILSWFIPEELGFLLRLDLEEVKLSSLKKNEILRILISSEENMLDYLSTFSGRILFGTWMKRVENVLCNLKFRVITQKAAIKTVRRRGYKDHGSCRPQDRWLEDHDFSWTEMQNLKEHLQDLLEEVTLSVQRFGLLGVRLPETER